MVINCSGTNLRAAAGYLFLYFTIGSLGVDVGIGAPPNFGNPCKILILSPSREVNMALYSSDVTFYQHVSDNMIE